MAHQGEAQSYYQEPQQPSYTPQQQPQYQQGGQYEQQKYAQPPPQYGSYGPQGYEAQGEKVDFNQAFKLDKPKWNDWWAGLLVRCLLFLALCFHFTEWIILAWQGAVRLRQVGLIARVGGC
jgi:hypothetical protein